MIVLDLPAAGFSAGIEDIIRLFFPTERLVTKDLGHQEASYLHISIIPGDLPGVVASYHTGERSFTWLQQDKQVEQDRGNQLKRLARLAVYNLLVELTGHEPGPWGILTGIRPAKVVHRLLDQGTSPQEIIKIMVSQYKVRTDKAELLVEVALRQRPFLPDSREAKQMVSIYVGIPFCPTKCIYCSFPSYPLTKHRSMVPTFFQGLKREVEEIVRAIKLLDLRVQTIYIGGGTPTILTAFQMDELLTSLAPVIGLATREITVEAGRPDTIDRKKLEICAGHGVTRVSINPQSMHKSTLERIGRQHGIEQVAAAVRLVRDLQIPVLNMDLIAGLPGENEEHLQTTLDAIKAFNPENLTVHTLAIKRAAKLRHHLDYADLPASSEVTSMLETVDVTVREWGLKPYYLYRQKQMLANLENVGYSIPGQECLYNIQMMEERQTIIGLGAGAGSKFIDPSCWTLENIYNPKDPLDYTRRVDELISRKIDKLKDFTQHLNVRSAL